MNVPIENGVVGDTMRIDRQAPTLRELSDKGAKVIVLSHFDRPKGKVVPSMSLKPIVAPLAKALGRPVAFAEDCVGEKAKSAVAKMKDGDVLLLENTRFHAGEEKDDLGFAKEVASLGDIFVNDAFSVAHRAHATTAAIAYLMPSAAGRSMQDELAHLHKALDDPERPVMAVVGGAKVSTKISRMLLEHLVKKVETLVIGGAMANTPSSGRGGHRGRQVTVRARPPRNRAASVIALSVESSAPLFVAADRCRRRPRVQGARKTQNGARSRGSERRNDPRCRTRDH